MIKFEPGTLIHVVDCNGEIVDFGTYISLTQDAFNQNDASHVFPSTSVNFLVWHTYIVGIDGKQKFYDTSYYSFLPA